jgi:hypothetical protein
LKKIDAGDPREGSILARPLESGMIAIACILVLATTAPTTQPATTAPTAYVVTAVKGVAQYRPAGESQWRRLEVGTELHNGDFVRTSLKTEVKMRRPDESEMIWNRLGTWEIGKERDAPTTRQYLPPIDQT